MQGYGYPPASGFSQSAEPGGYYRGSTSFPLGGGPGAATSSPTASPFSFLLSSSSSSSSLETVEKCSVIVIGLWDSARLLSQIQKLIREFHTRCGPVRAVHRFSVKPPACLLRPEYPGVALAVTFASEEAARAAVAGGGGEGAGGDGTSRPALPLPASVSTEGAGWAGIHGFRVSPMSRYRLSPEDAEDCRKTFMPISLMLRCMRDAAASNGRTGQRNRIQRGEPAPFSYLPPPHTLHPPVIANNSSNTSRSTAGPGTGRQGGTSRVGGGSVRTPVVQASQSVGAEQCFFDDDRGTPEEQAHMIQANDRWGIRDKLWFALCSDLSWYARIMDWTAAEAAAARGDAVVIDEEALCSVFNVFESSRNKNEGPSAAGLPGSIPSSSAMQSSAPPSPYSTASGPSSTGQPLVHGNHSTTTSANNQGGGGGGGISSLRRPFQFPLHQGSSSPSTTPSTFDALGEMQKRYGVSKSQQKKKRSRIGDQDDQDDGNGWGTWIASWLNGGVGAERETAYPTPTPPTATANSPSTARASSSGPNPENGALVVLPQRLGLLSRAVDWLCPGWCWPDALQSLLQYRPSRRRPRLETNDGSRHSSTGSGTAPLLVPFTCPPEDDVQNLSDGIDDFPDRTAAAPAADFHYTGGHGSAEGTAARTFLPAHGSSFTKLPGSGAEPTPHFPTSMEGRGSGTATAGGSSNGVAARFAAYREARKERFSRRTTSSASSETEETSSSTQGRTGSSANWFLFSKPNQKRNGATTDRRDEGEELPDVSLSPSFVVPPSLPSSLLSG